MNRRQHTCTQLDHAGLPCCYVDDKGIIVQANALWLKTFCLGELGRSVFECMSSSQRELIQILSAHHAKGPQQLQARWQLHTARTRWFQWSISPEESVDTPHFFIVVQEITAQKMMQSELEFAKNHAETTLDHLRQNMQLRSAFLANMSHEIRTPLNGLVGILSLLKTTQLDPVQADYVALMETSGQAMSEIINDVLDLSRIEANKVELFPQHIALREMLEELAVLVASTLTSHEVELVWTVDRRLPDDVLVDGVRLRQVLHNLLNNAVKFTPSGEVHLSAHLAYQDDHDVQIEFAVQDTGIGIEETRLAHIFDPFTQVVSSRRLDKTGTGLGLAICKKLIDAMGGELSVVSTPGQGSTFSFILPVKAEVQTQKKPEISAAQVTCERVLVLTKHPRRTHLIEELFDALEVPITVCEDLQHLPESRHERLLYIDVQDFGLEQVAATLGQDHRARCVALIAMGEPVEAYRAHPIIDEALSLPLRQASMLRSLQTLYPAKRKDVSPETRTIKLDPFDLSGLEEDSMGTLEGFSSLVHEVTARSVDSRKTKILLVEDHPVNQLITTTMLTQLGYDVTLCEHGKEAVDTWCGEQVFAAILMDCQMPVLDGYEATSTIREIEHTEQRTRIPIIGLSAYAFAHERARALSAGMDAYLNKPFTKEELAQELDTWIVSTPAPAPVSTHFTQKKFAHVALLDEQRLADLLESCGDHAFVLELFDTYKIAYRESQEALAELDSPWSREAASKCIKLQAHSLKGSSASLGLAKLAACFSQLEDHASVIERDELREYLEYIEVVSGLSMRSLSTWLERVA